VGDPYPLKVRLGFGFKKALCASLPIVYFGNGWKPGRYLFKTQKFLIILGNFFFFKDYFLEILWEEIPLRFFSQKILLLILPVLLTKGPLVFNLKEGRFISLILSFYFLQFF